jgi:adenine/guanine phosphoribosyltransferase-like PRPP-binding protein
MNYKDYIQNVPNWPVDGVLFKDITPLLQDSNMFNAAIDDISMSDKLEFIIVSEIISLDKVLTVD